MKKLTINQKKRYGDFTYLNILKSENMEIQLCTFFNGLQVPVDEFDRAYESVIDELIHFEDSNFQIFLIGSTDRVHLLIKTKKNNQKFLEDKLKDLIDIE